MINRSLTLAILVALIATGGRAARAQSSFSVDPLLIELDGQTNSAVLTLTNPTAKEIRFEIRAFAWDQMPPDGAMQLTPTEDVVIFPPLITLKPRMTQRVRVGTTASPGSVERSFRIMIEELPAGDAPPATNQVAIRTRVGIPVFLAPGKPARSGNIASTTIKNRTVNVTLQNTGTVHAMVDEVVIRGMAAADEQAFEQSIQGWYVLAGKSRSWTYTLRPTQCGASKFIEIEVFAHDKVLKNRVDLPANACTP